MTTIKASNGWNKRNHLYNVILNVLQQWHKGQRTHHGPAVFHQVDANNTQKCSKAQLEAQREREVGDMRRNIRVHREEEQVQNKTKHNHWASEEATVTHGDAGVISSDRHVVCASGRDQTHSQHHQSQSQQRHGHPQSRFPPAQVLSWGGMGGRNLFTSLHPSPLIPT